VLPLDNGRVSAQTPADAQLVSDLQARVEAERAGRPFLIYRDGDGRQQLFAFAPGAERADVGRQSSSDLVLDWDDQVSRVHARFERAPDGWVLVDDGPSRNGTFINEQRLSGRQRLTDGDTLRFGTGAGITWGSDPYGEWAETELKARRLLAVASQVAQEVRL